MRSCPRQRAARQWRGRSSAALTVARVGHIRETGALSRAPSTLCTQRPGSEQDPGLFLCGFNRPALRAQASGRYGRTTACGGRSLTSCRKATPVLAGDSPCTFADVAQQAEQGHAMAKTWVRDPSSAPLRVCPCTPRPRDMVLVARDVRDPWPGHVQRDTTSDGTLAFGHSRSGMSCSSRWLRTPPFQGGDAGSNPARDTSTRNLRRAGSTGVEIGRNDWAAPEPVTGWHSLGV